MSLWPFLECTNCGHGQTFAGRLVKRGQGIGYCDNCNGHHKFSMSKTPRTDAAEIVRSCINAPPHSGADGGAVGFDKIVTVDYARKLEQALQFYANDENWLKNHPFGSPVSNDRGNVAKDALDGMLAGKTSPMKTQLLPKGWTLARNSKTNRYAVRMPNGLLVKRIAPKKYAGGTKEEATKYAQRSARRIAEILRKSAIEEALWKKV